jgi:hypothetical protein
MAGKKLPTDRGTLEVMRDELRRRIGRLSEAHRDFATLVRLGLPDIAAEVEGVIQSDPHRLELAKRGIDALGSLPPCPVARDYLDMNIASDLPEPEAIREFPDAIDRHLGPLRSLLREVIEAIEQPGILDDKRHAGRTSDDECSWVKLKKQEFIEYLEHKEFIVGRHDKVFETHKSSFSSVKIHRRLWAVRGIDPDLNRCLIEWTSKRKADWRISGDEVESKRRSGEQ